MVSTKFGVYLPQGHCGELPDNISPEMHYDYLIDMASYVEKLNYHSAWLIDHFYTYPGLPQSSVLECWSTLSALAAETNRIKLAILMTCNSFRLPSLLAKMAATVDIISKGRLDFGIGAGWYQKEYDAYGIPFPTPSVRIKMLEEGVKIIKKLWTEDKVNFSGEHYSLNEAICEPKPIQKPHPSIMIGGEGEQLTLKVVAALADKCNLKFSPKNPNGFKKKLQIIEKYCRLVGRNYNEIEKTCYTAIIIGEDESELRRKVKEAEGLGEQWKKEIINGDMIIKGTPDDLISILNPVIEGELSQLYVLFPMLDKESIEIFSNKVISKL